MEANPDMEWVQVPKDATVVVHVAEATGEVIKAADIAAAKATEE
jgi:hypothetical protein